MSLRSLSRSVAASLLLSACLAGSVAAQDPAPEMSTLVSPTPAHVRLETFQEKQDRRDRSLVANVPLRGIGPTVMSGRVVDLAVSPEDPTQFYVAYASGGLWSTRTNGIAFEPLFEHQASLTIGDIEVDWRTGEIWVGTGENNSSRSSYAGTGVYRSSDGGASWEHLGLAETHHIGRIVLHPEDPQTAWVAAIGPLYVSGTARGVYKTTDGGETWTQTLFIDEDTGVIDLVIDPIEPSVLFAAAWHRQRRAWNFVEAGATSGIYKSEDGGETWTLLTTDGSGFPTGDGVGRIGLAVHPQNPEIVYALLDNQQRRPEEEDRPELTREMLNTMSREAFLEVGEEALEDYLERNGFPAAYTAQSVIEMVRNGDIDPIALVEYLEDANAQLFDTPVVGAEVYRSDDGGRSWVRTHEEPLDNVYYSYGYYFGEIRVAPSNPNQIYILGVPLLTSRDGGATFTSIGGDNVHVDHHALWVNPERPGHLIDGNDGGVNVSYDDGATWFKANTPPVGQFYTVGVDDAVPYNVYGGLQDNGVWVGPSTYEPSSGWYGEGSYPYKRLLGGDGMQVAVDTRDNDVVYTGFQFGNYFRIRRSTGQAESIKPEHALGERPLRFNWQAPLHLSIHNQDIVYFGSNMLHRSLDQGETWTAISGDLTRGGRPGDVPFGTLTSIDESPLQFGLLYAGSDDGLIHVTRDGGATWTEISAALPENMWVSRVEASTHAEERVYVSLNGYRWDHFESYVYRSDDAGASWSRIGEGLPAEPVNVVLEDPVNERLLYVGTDHGLYVSLDAGLTFMQMGSDAAFAPVHDVVVQPRAKDLVVGTHGRSLYIADVEHLQQLTPDLMEEALYVFQPDTVLHDEEWGVIEASWMEEDPPGIELAYYAGSRGELSLRVLDGEDEIVFFDSDDAERGLNYYDYGLLVNEEEVAEAMEAADDGRVYLLPGIYTVEMELNGGSGTVQLVIEEPSDES